MLPSMAVPSTYIKEGFSRNVDFNITYDPNISKAWRSKDKLDDTVASMSFGAAYSNLVGDAGLLIISGYLGYQDHQSYDDINLLSATLSGRYYMQFESGYLAPTYHVGLDIRSLHFANSDSRNGEMATFTLGVSKRINMSFLTSVSYQFNQRSAENKTYETKDNDVNFGIEYPISSKSTFYTDVEFSFGDHLSSAAGANSKFSKEIDAETFVIDPVYACANPCDYSTYRFDGDGISTTIGVVFTLSHNINLDLSARMYDWESETGIGSRDWAGNLGIIWQF